MSKALVLGAAALALSAGAASAQVPGYDYNGATVPLYGYAAPAYGYGYGVPLYNYGYGYAPRVPLYNYAAPAYAAPATAGTTVVIVTPGAPGYAAPYAAPSAVAQPLYAYAPGYGYGYTPGYWNRGYWGYGYGWR